jgi:DNA ligase-1
MQRLQQLLESLDSAANDAIKVQHLKSYFSSSPPEDAAWALFFLENKRIKTKTGQRILKEIIETQTGFKEWLIKECNDRVKDTPETLALLMPWSNGTCELSLSTLVVQFLQPLSGFSQLAKRETIRCAWEMLSTSQRVIFNKMILGGFHLGVQKTLVHEALSQISGIPKSILSRRLIEDWEPSVTWFQNLIKPDPEMDLAMTPCPFQTITESCTPANKSTLTSHREATWAYDGLRAQAVRRKDVSTIWSTDPEPLNPYFPELVRSIELLPSGTVLEGFIVGWMDKHPTSIENVHKRLKANSLNQKLFQTTPVHFMVLDIIERHGVDVSNRPFIERRVELEQVMEEWSHQWTLHGNNPTNEEVNPDVFQQEMFDMGSVLKPEPEKPVSAPPMSLSELNGYDDWASVETDLKKCRDKNATGLLLSPCDSQEKLSHNDNGWILVKPAPFKVKLALISAERVPGNQTIFSQYTFGAWHHGSFVSVAILGPIHSELASESLSEFVIENTEQKRGNNWQVKAGMICEISFEAIQKSPRSKSGIRLQNPRMNECGSSKDLKQVTSVEKIISLVKE